jgi:hypothetical protein
MNNQAKFHNQNQIFNITKSKRRHPKIIFSISKTTQKSKVEQQIQNLGKWETSETERFIEALALYGTYWPMVVAHIGTRSRIQVISKYQKLIKMHTRRYFKCCKYKSFESVEEYIQNSLKQSKLVPKSITKLSNCDERIATLVTDQLNRFISKDEPVINDRTITDTLSSSGDGFGVRLGQPSGGLGYPCERLDGMGYCDDIEGISFSAGQASWGLNITTDVMDWTSFLN